MGTKKKETRTCSECKTEYTKKKTNTATTYYCSKECKTKDRNRRNKKYRDKIKQRAETDLSFCSLETFKKYRQRSPYRKLEFSLSYEDFRNNINKPCYYCGEEYNGSCIRA